MPKGAISGERKNSIPGRDRCHPIRMRTELLLSSPSPVEPQLMPSRRFPSPPPPPPQGAVVSNRNCRFRPICGERFPPRVGAESVFVRGPNWKLRRRAGQRLIGGVVSGAHPERAIVKETDGSVARQ